MDLRRFWMTWRRDIMRGAGLFAVVLIAGLTIGSVVGRVRRGFNFNFDGLNSPELAGPAAPGDTAAVWTWSGKIAPKQSVWLKNVNGDVEVEPAAGDSVAVVVEKSGRRSQFGAVRLVAVQGGGVTICALWGSGSRHCGAEGDYEAGSLRTGGRTIQVATLHGSIQVRYLPPQAPPRPRPPAPPASRTTS